MGNENQLQKRKDNAAQQFRRGVQGDAESYLISMLPKQQARHAAARVSMAFAAAARTAKDPSALYNCNRASIVAAVANSALTNLMPGGALANVWLVPKGGELQWWLSHRGMCALALRAGYQLIAVPVHAEDHVRIEFGEVAEHDADPEAWAGKLDDIIGVYVKIRRVSDGADLGRPWMPLAAIQQRRKSATTQKVWKAWPIEMAQKTAIRWVMARGYVPVDTEMQHALEGEPQIIEVRQEDPTPVHPHGDLGLDDNDFEPEPEPTPTATAATTTTATEDDPPAKPAKKATKKASTKSTTTATEPEPDPDADDGAGPPM